MKSSIARIFKRPNGDHVKIRVSLLCRVWEDPRYAVNVYVKPRYKRDWLPAEGSVAHVPYAERPLHIVQKQLEYVTEDEVRGVLHELWEELKPAEWPALERAKEDIRYEATSTGSTR